ncbi:hypothetical protein PBCV1_a686aL [Paramecium bursaria Chlorella virus 1]|uniref:Uncharacterized protein n=1 Tax=Paramecium bursaria Chlorella virus 1 TaxID=10506 RepID=F8TU86_PBCV1|nr:hypothetical protein PBCV1_a686aL [Paramecium bursaria Chlorella virus 1]AEI70147.1 hypothetical protein [Paramecium bursaria Chlorella virus 1]
MTIDDMYKYSFTMTQQYKLKQTQTNSNNNDIHNKNEKGCVEVGQVVWCSHWLLYRTEFIRSH